MINLESIVVAVKEDGSIQGTTRDDTILRKAQAAWKEMEGYCGQPLVAEEGNVVWDLRGALRDPYRFVIPYFPVQAIESFSYRSYGNADVTIDPATYALIRDSMYFDTGFTPGYFYTAVLTVGAVDIPPDVLDVAVELTIHSLARTKIQGIGEGKIGMQQRSESNPALGTATQVYRDERAAILDRLKGYRVPLL